MSDEKCENKGGNTIPPLNQKKKDNQLFNWSFTLFNYETNYELFVNFLDTICKTFFFQTEISPTTGKKHLQGYLNLYERVRFSQLKDLLIDFPQIHLEGSKGTMKQNLLYCSKSATRDADYKFVSKGVEQPKELTYIEYDKFYQWEKDMYKLLLDVSPNDRTIYWICDKDGCNGKSQFVRHMLIKHSHKCCVFTSGKTSDIAQTLKSAEEDGVIDLRDNPIFLFDIARSNINKIRYDALECLKNGFISSPKYESCTLLFNTPHILVMANDYPDTTQMSQDRWIIYNLENKLLTLIDTKLIKYM